jgi:hypothetical protein
MYAAKVVVHVEQRYRVHVVLNLLRERISKSGKSPHVHSHSEVLALNVASAHVLWVRRSKKRFFLRPKALRRAVPLLTFRIIPVDFNELSVVDIIGEGINHGTQVHLVTVGSQLDPMCQASRNIAQKLRSTSSIAATHEVADNELRLRVNGNERPNVPGDLFGSNLLGDILFFGVAETPNLVDLDALGGNVAERHVQVTGACFAYLRQKAKDGSLGNSRHARRGAYGATLDKSRDDRYFLLDAKVVRHNHIVRYRFSIIKKKVDLLLRKLRLFGMFLFGPTGFCCVRRGELPFRVGHGLKSTLTADLTSPASHFSHHLRDHRNLQRFRSFDGLQDYAPGVLDGVEFLATPLWHTSSVAWFRRGSQPEANFKLTHYANSRASVGGVLGRLSAELARRRQAAGEVRCTAADEAEEDMK